MQKTEKQKMEAFLPYFANDEELTNLRLEAQNIWLEFNQTGNQKLLPLLFKQNIDTLRINPPFHCDYGYSVKFGKNVFINFNCTFLTPGGIEIGDNCWIGPDVKIYTAIHPLDFEKRNTGLGSAKPVKIGKNCWIGGGAVILPDVTIGENTVIGAGSVVVKDIPANCTAAGNHCKVLRYLK